MSRLVSVTLVVLIVGAAVALSGARFLTPALVFQTEKVNPVTHLRFPDSEEFSFAIVSDRTGGHRANIFSQAVEKLNLLQPQFVVSVGDLIEGGKMDKNLPEQWQEFDAFVNKLQMPFFYVPGNHDAASPTLAKFWEEKLGRRHYHFVYRNVLFLVINSEDPPGVAGLSQQQIADAARVLGANKDVRWTLVFVHRPLWTDAAKSGWDSLEKALGGRNYTVFAGHIHRFQKFVRQGMNYYQLATTGGSSPVRGTEYGEFDHITWVTLKKAGPVISHVMLDAILPENLQTVTTKEPGVKRPRKPTFEVAGKIHFEGSPIPGAVVTFTPIAKDGAKASGKVEADGSFRLTTYQAFDGAVAGDYQVTVSWKDPRTGKSLLPATSSKTAPLQTKVQAGTNSVILDLKR